MIKYNGEVYREFRCPNCRALLFEEYVYSGRIRIKCPRCGQIHTLKCKTPKSVLQQVADN